MHPEPPGRSRAARRSRTRAAWWTLLGTLLLAAEGGLPRPTQAAGRGVAIVVNPQTPVDDLSLAELRRVFLGQRQFWTPKIRVVLLIGGPGTPSRDLILRIVYQMSEAQFRQYWIAMIMRAEVTAAPRAVTSPQEADELVSGMPGAIAFVPSDRVGPGVKVLRINGKLPGESGYPLQ